MAQANTWGTSALTFQSTAFDVVVRDGQPWIRGYQIGSALGYTQPDAAIAKLYDRNQDEFTDRMTAVVKLDSVGGAQDTRLFSLRGAHLLAMFARTAKAAEFRRWVLDVLDREVEQLAEPQPVNRIDILQAEAMQAAHTSALQYFSDYRKAVGEGRGSPAMTPIPDEVLTGLLAEALMERRFLLSFDYRFGMAVQPIPKDAMVANVPQMASAIVNGHVKPSPQELLSMVSACTSILAQRAGRKLAH